MEDIQSKINYKHKYECIKALLNKKRIDNKKLISVRNDLITELLKLKKKIQNLENELGVSNGSTEHGDYAVLENSDAHGKTDELTEPFGNEPLEKITNIERVYCEVCPHELTETDIIIGICERCGNKIDP